jgi:O-antigen biosynthesis protein
MSLSKSSDCGPAEWPLLPQPTNGELAQLTDAHEFIDSPKRCVVCVLGMHRSGTSVAARLINLLGVSLGAEDDLLAPKPDNPTGYWEYRPILELNDEILARLGGSFHQPPPLTPGWEMKAELADLRRRARDLVACTFAAGNWGWKDPRTCLTLPFWKQILAPVQYVICMRSPAEVAASLETRDGSSVEKCIRLWHIYTAAAIEQTTGHPRHFIFYEDVVNSARNEVARLARFLGRSDALERPAVQAAIEEFVKPELHRERTSLINTVDNPNILFPANALYFAVRIAARSGKPRQEVSDISRSGPVDDQIWNAFSRSSRRAQEDLDELTRSRSSLESRLSESSAHAHELQVRVSSVEMEAAVRDVEQRAAEERSKELEADNQQLAEERSLATTLVSELRAELEKREALCQEHARAIAERDAEIAALAERAALVQRLEEDRVARQSEIETIRSHFRELQAENRRLAQQRDRAHAVSSELRAGLDERAAIVAALESRLTERLDERAAVVATLESQLTERFDERGAFVATLESQLTERFDERAAFVAALESRVAERLAAWEGISDKIRDTNETDSRLEAGIVALAEQIGGLAAGFAQMRSCEEIREAATLQIRDQLSARQDEIRAIVSRLSGTIDYLGMTRRVRADMRRVLPPATQVVVISKGDPDLLDLQGQDVKHFPQDDWGHFAGHYPADNGEAIAHLEAVRARGARFLVIPSSSFWWLEHYTDLARHLDTTYHRVWSSADCQIYDLAGLDQSPRVKPVPSDVAATPAPPAPEPGSMIAVCDMPGPDGMIVGPGHLRVRGWALSKAGIKDVELFVDSHPREGVAYGGSRFDVEAVYPDFPDAHHSGFVGKLDLEGLAEGDHSLAVRIRSLDGCEMELIRSFRLDPHARPDRADLNAEYPDWLARRIPSEVDLARMRIEGKHLRYQPLISLVVPVYNAPEKFLGLMVDSVMAQTYEKWELCLADDASTVPHVRPFLDRLARRDSRVKIAHLSRNQGISGASNAALGLAKGEFIGLLDHDDILAPSALFEVVRALNDAPATDLLYSDEDKVDETGTEHWDPFFKPDWSPDLLLSINYVCHFGVYRRSLIETIGGFRSEYDGSQDYDLVLRFTELTNRILHLPSILYSWRAIPGSAARDLMAKPYAVDAARRAIDDALRRRGVAGRAEPGQSLGQWRVRYDLRNQPGVTIVIPAGGNTKCLKRCLESVLERSTYTNLHILVTDDSDGPAVADLCRTLGKMDARLSYRRFRLKPFNYSAINNSAVSLIDTPYVVLLNDDTEVITPDWVEAMLEHAQRPEVGVVGAKLLYSDRSLQHVGVIMGPRENCDHAFRHLSEEDPGYFGFPRLIRNWSAVTFACAMMRRSVFDEVGGLDTENLAMAYNDVDMCLRIRERGYWVVYTPYAVLFHYESSTRSMHSYPGEEHYMKKRWADVICHDPFYNPNLTREAEDYSLNFDAPSIAERLGVIEDDPRPVSQNSDNRREPLFAPILEPQGEADQDQAGDRLFPATSKTVIDMVTSTIELGRHIGGMEGLWKNHVNELTTWLDQQKSRSLHEREAQSAGRGLPALKTPGAQYRERAGSTEPAGRRTAGYGEQLAPDSPRFAAPGVGDPPDGINGYRRKRSSYPYIRQRIREAVNAELPTGCVVVVVSRGDDNLLQLGPRQGWHFPQTEAGEYAGFHPADSSQAIAYLEEVRSKGADFLLFPSTAFWWLGFYGDFQKYLESRYPCVCSDPSCLIFELSTTVGGHNRRP